MEAAHVIPIPKMKAPKTPADTRPISILPAISKFVEKLVQHQLVNYVETYHLMSEQQHGHREHRSTETALAVIADRVPSRQGRGDISRLTILDQSKGSVIVPHQTLLDKLKAELDEQLGNWKTGKLSKTGCNRSPVSGSCASFIYQLTGFRAWRHDKF